MYWFMYSKLDDFLLGKKVVSSRLLIIMPKLIIMGNSLKLEEMCHFMNDGLDSEGGEV